MEVIYIVKDIIDILANIDKIDRFYPTGIDNIFKAILSKYKKGVETLPFFEKDNAPAIIDIHGEPFERIAQIAMYVTEDGDAYGEDQSLIDINELAEMNKLLREQKEATAQEKKSIIIT